MDWTSISRLIPEVGVLVVVGYFALRGISIFKEIVDKIDKEHSDALSKLSKSIDKSTKATLENTKATKSADIYLRERNGRDGEIHAAQIKTISTLTTTLKDRWEKDSKQQNEILKAVQAIGKQEVTEQHVEHLSVEHTHVEHATIKDDEESISGKK